MGAFADGFILGMPRRVSLLAGTGLASLFAAGLTIVARPASAQLPTGGQVTAGSASIREAGNRMDIVQGTARAAIDWRGFSIGAGNVVHFQQPSASAVALNRVTGPDPSVIAGQLSANGRLVLMNPNGITFSQGSRVDTAGLVATTLGVSTGDFMAGRLRFDQPGRPGAAVVNEGEITVREGGLAALVAPEVRNSGVIRARLGQVVLAGAEGFTLNTIDPRGDGLIRFEIGGFETAPGGPARETRAQNTGRIEAQGGSVSISAASARGIVAGVVNVDGQVIATSVGERNGVVTFGSGENGTTTVAGTVDVRGTEAGQRGGGVRVTGDRVRVASTARIDASGRAGGGEVKIGGNLQGRGPEQNARRTVVERGAEIRADATERGNGGSVIVWSDEYTRFMGGISATGGPLGGDGGFAEVSGKLWLGFEGTVDLSAPRGRGGSLLLDPTDIDIRDVAANVDIALNGTTFEFADTPPPGATPPSILSRDVLQDQLNAGTSITVSTAAGANQANGGRITVVDGVTWTTAATLTLSATTDIRVNAPITASAAGGSLTMNAGTGIAIGAALNLGAGTLTASTANGDITQAATGVITAASVSATATNGSVLLATATNLPPGPAAPISVSGSAGGPGGAFEFRSNNAATQVLSVNGITANDRVVLTAAQGNLRQATDPAAAAISAPTVIANSPAGSVELRNTSNAVGTVQGQASGGGALFSFVDAGTGNSIVTAQSITSTTSITIRSEAGTVRAGADLIGTVLTLDGVGGVTQSAPIGSAAVPAQVRQVHARSANGSVILENPDNFITAIEGGTGLSVGGPASGNGDFRVRSAASLTVGGVAGPAFDGINVAGNTPTTGGASARLVSGGDVTLTEPVRVGGGRVLHLEAGTTAAGSTGSLTLNALLQAPDGTGVLVADTIGGNPEGRFQSGLPAATVIRPASANRSIGFGSDAAGALALNATMINRLSPSLTGTWRIGSVNRTGENPAGAIELAGGDFVTQTLALESGLGGAGDVAIRQRGAITAAGVAVRTTGAGGAYLTNSGNAIGRLAGQVGTGPLQFRTSGSVAIDSIPVPTGTGFVAQDGITRATGAATASVAVRAGASIAVSQPIDAGSGGAVWLQAGAGNTNTITQANNATITAGTLLARAGGNIQLAHGQTTRAGTNAAGVGANAVATLAAEAGGNVVFRASGDLAVGTVGNAPPPPPAIDPIGIGGGSGVTAGAAGTLVALSTTGAGSRLTLNQPLGMNNTTAPLAAELVADRLTLGPGLTDAFAGGAARPGVVVLRPFTAAPIHIGNGASGGLAITDTMIEALRPRPGGILRIGSIGGGAGEIPGETGSGALNVAGSLLDGASVPLLAGRTLVLESAGDVTQAAAIGSNGLAVAAGGDVTLADPGNAVGTYAGRAGGTFFVNGGVPGAVPATATGTFVRDTGTTADDNHLVTRRVGVSGQDIHVRSPGDLHLTVPISAGPGGTIRLEAGFGGISGNITQETTGIVTTGSLVALAPGMVDLAAARVAPVVPFTPGAPTGAVVDNQAATVAGFAGGQDGGVGFRFRDATGGLEVGSVAAGAGPGFSGIRTAGDRTGGTPPLPDAPAAGNGVTLISVAGPLAVAEGIDAGAGANSVVRLQAARNVSQQAGIIAEQALVVSQEGTVSLDHAGNRIGTIAGSAGGAGADNVGFRVSSLGAALAADQTERVFATGFVAGDPIAALAVNGRAGIRAVDATTNHGLGISLQARPHGTGRTALFLDGTVDADGAGANPSANITLRAQNGDVYQSATGFLVAQGVSTDAPAGFVDLARARDRSATMQSVAGNPQMVDNQVAVIAGRAGANDAGTTPTAFRFRRTGASPTSAGLTIGTVTVDPAVAGQTSEGITAQNLNVSVVATAGGLALQSGPAGVAVDAGTTGTVRLRAGAGDLTQSATGLVTAGDLLAEASGNVVLPGGLAERPGRPSADPGNAVDTLAGSAGGDFLFRNARSLTVGSVVRDAALPTAEGGGNGATVFAVGAAAGPADNILALAVTQPVTTPGTGTLTVAAPLSVPSGGLELVADRLARGANGGFAPGGNAEVVVLRPFTAGTNLVVDSASASGVTVDSALVDALAPLSGGTMRLGSIGYGVEAASGGLTLNQAIDFAGALVLEGTSIGQEVSVGGVPANAMTLVATSSGDVNLPGVNSARFLTGSAGGDFRIRTFGDTEVGQTLPAATDPFIATTGPALGNRVLVLTQGDGIVAGGDVGIDVVGGRLFLGRPVTAGGDVRLQADFSITQDADGLITANRLLARSFGRFVDLGTARATFDATPTALTRNTVSLISGEGAADETGGVAFRFRGGPGGAGTLTVGDAGADTVLGIDPADGVRAIGQQATIVAAQGAGRVGLNLDRPVDVDATGTARLLAENGDITQGMDGPITAGQLLVLSPQGFVHLRNAGNAVGVVAGLAERTDTGGPDGVAFRMASRGQSVGGRDVFQVGAVTGDPHLATLGDAQFRVVARDGVHALTGAGRTDDVTGANGLSVSLFAANFADLWLGRPVNATGRTNSDTGAEEGTTTVGRAIVRLRSDAGAIYQSLDGLVLAADVLAEAPRGFVDLARGRSVVGAPTGGLVDNVFGTVAGFAGATDTGAPDGVAFRARSFGLEQTVTGVHPGEPGANPRVFRVGSIGGDAAAAIGARNGIATDNAATSPADGLAVSLIAAAPPAAAAGLQTVDLWLTGEINASGGPAGTVRLAAENGNIRQTTGGDVRANELLASAPNGLVILQNPTSNDVNTFAAASNSQAGGKVFYRDATDLQIGSISGDAGVGIGGVTGVSALGGATPEVRLFASTRLETLAGAPVTARRILMQLQGQTGGQMILGDNTLQPLGGAVVALDVADRQNLVDRLGDLTFFASSTVRLTGSKETAEPANSLFGVARNSGATMDLQSQQHLGGYSLYLFGRGGRISSSSTSIHPSSLTVYVPVGTPVNLFGTVNGQVGANAAAVSRIGGQPPASDVRFNNCPISGSIGCNLLTISLPPIPPLGDSLQIGTQPPRIDDSTLTFINLGAEDSEEREGERRVPVGRPPRAGE